MKIEKNIISGFDDKVDSEVFAVDFAVAERLERSGSTCDAYVCRVQRRRVFVKRLKAEFRNNPLYRAAFDKEYDIGVSLSHPSLPRYVGFGGDYIVMDFIEGDTLADMIKRGDSRLGSRKFIRRLLLELVDVVEYLHRRNIVHCDIKADNVIVSPYDDRPINLIDLDKAYTSWLETTHGNPRKYGCEGCADGAVDFRGIGKIAAQLNFDRIDSLCGCGTVTASQLRQCLQPRNRRWIFPACAGVVTMGLYLAFVGRSNGEVAAEPLADSITIVAPTVDAMQSEKNDSDIAAPQHKGTVIPVIKADPGPAIDKAWIEELVHEKTDSIKLLQSLLQEALNDSTLTRAERANRYMDYEDEYSRIFYGIITAAVEHHPRSLEVKVQMEVRENPRFQSVEQTNLELTRQAYAR